MAENSGISWTDHTFNPWLGCTNVSPACDHCYAEKLVTTRLGVGWGNDAERRRTAPSTWAKVRIWNKKADAFKAEHGHYPRVFSASLADIFDNKVPPEWRVDFWALVRETPKLQWLIVTKRIGNVAKMLPPDWGAGYLNVVLIITVANQTEADRDIPKLLATPARWRGLSIEPMLGPVDLAKWFFTGPMIGGGMPMKRKIGMPVIDWVITGGESRQLPGPRDLVPLEAQWVRDVAKQCTSVGVPHHFKQWGYTIPINQVSGAPPGGSDFVLHSNPSSPRQERRVYFKEWMGRKLDGVEHNDFPPAL